jgi:hypothetical protein
MLLRFLIRSSRHESAIRPGHKRAKIMKTGDLVDLLSKNVETVDGREIPCKLLFSAGLGVLAARPVLMLVLGPHAKISGNRAWLFIAAKLIFAGAILILALIYFAR